MITVNSSEDAAKYKISTRLLMIEALSAGYDVSYFPSSPSTQSGITRCVKDGKEFFFKSTATSLVPAYGVFAAENKALTYSLLSLNGVLTPETTIIAGDEGTTEGQKLLKKHGRVVVKPVDTNHGDGITVNVTTEEQLSRAVIFARQAGGKEPDTIIQQQVGGTEYRFLVVEGKTIAVANRQPPCVVGDGQLTIGELIARKNQDPRRSDGHQSELTRIDIEDVRHHKGEDFLLAIPENEEIVQLLDTSNLSRGGEAVDVTDLASQALKRLAESAAKHCFLGIAGVDIMTLDITNKKAEGSYVIEVNLTPGIRMHQFPSQGTPRNVVKAVFSAIERTARPIGRDILHIGRSEEIGLPEFGADSIPARIDTGATITSVWASDIKETKEGLSFTLFDKKSHYFSGKMITQTEYGKRVVSSSMGQAEVRYTVKMLFSIHGRCIRATVTLSDRSKQIYPILIGRNVLKNKFIVDVGKGTVAAELERIKRRELDGIVGNE